MPHIDFLILLSVLLNIVCALYCPPNCPEKPSGLWTVNQTKDEVSKWLNQGKTKTTVCVFLKVQYQATNKKRAILNVHSQVKNYFPTRERSYSLCIL